MVFFKGSFTFENNVARKSALNGEAELAFVKHILLRLNTKRLVVLLLTLNKILIGTGMYFFSSSFLGTGGTHRPSGMFLNGSVFPLIKP